jgi:hypothetical protein
MIPPQSIAGIVSAMMNSISCLLVIETSWSGTKTIPMKLIRKNGHFALNVVISFHHAFAESFRFPERLSWAWSAFEFQIVVFDTLRPVRSSWIQGDSAPNSGKVNGG